MNAPSCEWREDGDGTWWTGCENLFTLIDGTPSGHMFFCCFCGGPLVAVGFQLPAEDEE